MQNTARAGATAAPAAGPKPGDEDSETHLNRLLAEERYAEYAVYLHAIAPVRAAQQPPQADRVERARRNRVRRHAATKRQTRSTHR